MIDRSNLFGDVGLVATGVHTFGDDSEHARTTVVLLAADDSIVASFTAYMRLDEAGLIERVMVFGDQ